MSASMRATDGSGTPLSVASSPAGAFHTPRCASVRAITPATAPLGAKVSTWFSFSGWARAAAGRTGAALALLVPARIETVRRTRR